MITEAFKFMILGMGTVFLFLIIMVFSLKLQSFLVAKYSQKRENNSNTISDKVNDDTDLQHAAIISAVIDHHNKANG